MVHTKNAWYILGFQYVTVTHKMTDLFLSKGMQWSELDLKGLLNIRGWDKFTDSAHPGKGVP